jgi:ATP adenylyltransferase
MRREYSYKCDFCDAIGRSGDIGNTEEFQYHVGDSLPTRTVWESENFAVVASLGQIVEGYLLILSKAHYPSMSHVPSEFFDELNEIYGKTRSLLSETYADPFIFEHGPMPLGQTLISPAIGGGSCVDHAHFHFVPVTCSTEQPVHILEAQYTSRRIVELVELKDQAKRGVPYIFVETVGAKRLVFDAPLAPPQYVRSLLAHAMGEPEKGNWRTRPEPERLIATVQALRDRFSD